MRLRTKFLRATGLFLTLALLLATAQEQPIQVTTRLVQVVTVVRDKNGPVSDLTKGDFTLTDGGKKREIATFSVAKASDQVQRSSLPPNTFSNHLDQSNDPPVAATVLLFDSLNTQFKDQATTRQQTLGYLKSIDPQSPIAIYALGNKLSILHDFTDDRARLAQALNRYHNSTPPLLNNSSTAGLVTEATTSTTNSPPPSSQGEISVPSISTDMLTDILEPLANYALDRRVSMTLSAIQVIANRMAGVPGRKNLIWISGAFPLSLAFDRGGLSGSGQRPLTYAGPLREAAVAIDRANVAVYPVDARGLQAFDTIKVETTALRDQRTVGGTNNQMTAEEMAGSREIETMKLLADWTGGKAFYNTNDIRGAIKQANEDAEVTYTLGFYADEKDLDGTYRELKVKVDRKGVDVRNRKGYFATPLAKPASQSATDILTNAAFAPADATGIGLTATIAPNPQSPGNYNLALGMDLHTIRLVQDEKTGKWTGGLNFGIIQQSADGKVVDTVAQNVSLNITDENRQKLLQNGLILRLAVKPAPGMTQIRAAVMDQLSGNAGSLRILPPK